MEAVPALLKIFMGSALVHFQKYWLLSLRLLVLFFGALCRNLRYYFKSHPIVWILVVWLYHSATEKNICSRLNTVVGIFCNHCQQSHILSHFRSLYISYFHIVIVESWYRLVHFVQKCLDSRSLKEDINTFLTIIWWNLHFIILHIMSI